MWTLSVGNLRIVTCYRFISVFCTLVFYCYVYLYTFLPSASVSHSVYIPDMLSLSTLIVFIFIRPTLLFSSLPLGGLLYWIAWLQTKWFQRSMEKQDTGESSTCKRLFIHQPSPLLPTATFLLLFD